ncbi:uncharacterized protein LOC116295589 [Actinia tenebrosa]|uniref:Uncharacterized protein LOC116295589 n=1 Tax=Actinia tenebrosa TaxID=6105 RepID=A0A6P8I325_ACTTE|nr:uncharacterized protein LOC116295589 [Actinia tenebrosa]
MLLEFNLSSNLMIPDELTDISRLPELTFGDVEEYARKESGCSSTTKAYKFCAEPGYLHNIKVRYSQEKAKLNSRCYRSMKKSKPPHTLEADIDLASKSIKGRCSCSWCWGVLSPCCWITVLHGTL